MDRKLLVLPLLLALLFLFFGCTGAVSDAKGSASFNSDGSGSAQFTFVTSSTYADRVVSELRSSFGSKKNFNLVSGSGYTYTASYNFDTPSGLTAYSRFEKYSETGWAVVYRYSDTISLDTVTGKSNSQSLPFTYCVQMPTGTTVRRVIVDGSEWTPSSTVCMKISEGKMANIIIESGVEAAKIGCTYSNPPCNSNQNCVNDQCVLKSGCTYNNPPCGDSYDCIANQCILKKGCKYNNPACDEDHNCINNVCVLKPGCRYDNPPCDDKHACFSNSCALKKGCRYDNPVCTDENMCMNNVCTPKLGCNYDNPMCKWNEACNTNNNSCEPNYLVYGLGILLVLVGLGGIFWYGLRYKTEIANEIDSFSNTKKTKKQKTNKREHSVSHESNNIHNHEHGKDYHWYTNPKGLFALLCFICAFALILLGVVFIAKDNWIFTMVCPLPLSLMFFAFGAFLYSGAKTDMVKEAQIDHHISDIKHQTESKDKKVE